MTNKATSDGVGCTTVILIVFIILKLTNLIDWSWWWVLSPFWIPALIAIVILGIYGLYKWKQDA